MSCKGIPVVRDFFCFFCEADIVDCQWERLQVGIVDLGRIVQYIYKFNVVKIVFFVTKFNRKF